MKEKIIIASIIVAVIGFFYMRFLGNRPKYTLLYIRDVPVKVEKADTLGKQRQGLSDRESLGADEGMLFIMGVANYHAFEMRRMKFPLDIVWIREGKVVDVSLDVPNPHGNEKPAIIKPAEPADLVLEVNAGWARTHQIKVGDAVRESK